MAFYSMLLSFVALCLTSHTYALLNAGEVVCRYPASTADSVNYYTCQSLSDKYGINVQEFFKLNPGVSPACDNVKANTEYCVRGYIQQTVSTDGMCGPQHGNTTCLDTDKQCCNSETWTCGNTIDDCMPGTCFSGACMGFPDKYTLDGKCGIQNGNKLCGGKWGACCNAQGQCGNGTDFCTERLCQSGSCDVSFQIPWPSAGGNSSSPAPDAGKVSPDGSCGGLNKSQCKGSTYGDCCSSAGYCGATAAHCTGGCQKDFGICTTSDLSQDGTCGGTDKRQCKGSGFGDCCSSVSFCGDTAGHCTTGCQTAFGTCSDATSLSPDGSCGGSMGYKCPGSSYGNCCSSSGFCGVTGVHCGTGCQANFGDCFITYLPSSDMPSYGKVSTDGKCGGSAAVTCAGSSFGNCCSSTGSCGTSVNHCAQGCQGSFSSACLTSNVPSLNGDCGTTKGGYTCANGPFNGQCCSLGGFCGTTDAHCKSGCQKGYGTCK